MRQITGGWTDMINKNIRQEHRTLRSIPHYNKSPIYKNPLVDQKRKLKNKKNSKQESKNKNQMEIRQHKKSKINQRHERNDNERKNQNLGYEVLNNGMNELDLLEGHPTPTQAQAPTPEPLERIIKDILTHVWQSLSVPK
jgi:hypothetical protein